jgi:hypothetical protein
MLVLPSAEIPVISEKPRVLKMAARRGWINENGGAYW